MIEIFYWFCTVTLHIIFPFGLSDAIDRYDQIILVGYCLFIFVLQWFLCYRFKNIFIRLIPMYMVVYLGFLIVFLLLLGSFGDGILAMLFGIAAGGFAVALILGWLGYYAWRFLKKRADRK